MKQKYEHDCPGGGGGGGNGGGALQVDNPVSFSLAANQDAKDVIVGTTSTPVAGKMVLLVGDTATVDSREAVVGSFRTLFRFAMQHTLRQEPLPGNLYIFDDWAGASAATATINADGSGSATTDIFIILSATFRPGTHFLQETFNQLINAYLENTKEN